MWPAMRLGLPLTVAAILACSDSQGPGDSGQPSPAVLLKNIDASSLPAPYYHFEYDGEGLVTRVAFASDLRIYDVRYRNGRITELQNNTAGNADRLQYVYDAAGRVDTVNYIDNTGAPFARVRLAYDGDRLSTLERERKLAGVFTLEKTMTFSYYADGNLQQIVDHRPAVNGTEASTTVDRFEQYDSGVNVDAFSLIHNHFFDHVVLLPDVRLQQGNPGRETFTGGSVDYRVDYTYTYDDLERPLLKTGSVSILTGPDSGRVLSVSTAFSYYP